MNTPASPKICWSSHDLDRDTIARILDIPPAHVALLLDSSLDRARTAAWYSNDRERFAACNSELRRRNLAAWPNWPT
jgi:hypothetical protein